MKPVAAGPGPGRRAALALQRFFVAGFAHSGIRCGTGRHVHEILLASSRFTLGQ